MYAFVNHKPPDNVMVSDKLLQSSWVKWSVEEISCLAFCDFIQISYTVYILYLFYVVVAANIILSTKLAWSSHIM